MSSKPSVKSGWANGSKTFDFLSVDHEVPGLSKTPTQASGILIRVKLVFSFFKKVLR